MSERRVCELCGEPMPDGEEMFKFHGYSGPCPNAASTTPADASPAAGASTSEEETKLVGTYECPICAWPEPHAHSKFEIAQRPFIDGARAAFEERMVSFLKRPEFFSHMSRELSRSIPVASRVGQHASISRAHGDWAYRMAPDGSSYHNEIVQTLWELWRDAWMTARIGSSGK